MANLENNNDNENKKSVAENISDSVQKGVENVQDSVKEAVKGAAELASDAINRPVETAGELVEQAAKDVTSYKWWAKLLLIIFWLGLFIVTAALVAVNLPVTKRWAANQALQILNQDFKAEMSTEDVQVDYFGDVLIKGLTIKDYRGLEFIKVREFRANSNWLELVRNVISGKSNSLSFDGLTLKDADIKVITYKGDSISNFIRYVGNFDSGKTPDPNKPPFELNSRVDIINSKVSIINQNSEGDQGKWLYADQFNLHAPRIKVKGGDVYAQVNNLSFATTRWGKRHFVDTFSTNVALTGKSLELQDLTLFTDHTLLQGNLKFNLNNGSWSDFTDKVRWDMNLKQGSYVSGYDISYFVTDWDNYKPINLFGTMEGPLNDFHLRNFVLGNHDVSIRSGNIKLANLLKGNFLIETNDISTDFTYVGLKDMLPKFISSKMKNFADDFGRLRYTGGARVTPDQIYIPKGNLLTGIGRANIHDFYLTGYSTDMPRYKGYAEVYDLNTTAITKSREVGLITGKFNIDGQSFDVNTMRLQTRSQIASIEIMDKVINNVHLDGLLDRRTYRGIITVNDEQARADINGFIDFRSSRIAADVKADIRHLNINYFTGGKGNQIVSGQMDGKIAMTSLDDLNLDAQFNNINFASGGQKFYIPNAQLKAFLENGNRVVSVDAPGAVTGRITGKYNLGDLPGMIENGLNKILVGPAPRKLYRGQHFNMEFDVRQDLVNYFVPDVRIPRGAFVNGSYDGNANNLVLNADAEELKYYITTQEEITLADQALAAVNPDYALDEKPAPTRDSVMVSTLALRINTANLDEQIFAKIDRAQYQEHVLRDFTVTGRNENNELLRIATSFRHGTPKEEVREELKSYAININQSTNEFGDYVVRFDPTSVQFNDVTWSVDTSPLLNHSIVYRKQTKDIEINNLRIFSEDSELLVQNAVVKSGDDFRIEGEVKNLQIAKLLEMQSGGNTLDLRGIAQGKFNIVMNQSNLEPLVDLRVEDIYMSDESMGTIVLSAKNSPVPNVFDINAQVISSGILGGNNLLVSGTVDNNTASPTVDIKAEMKDFDLRFANQFVTGIFSNMRGKANGDLLVTGTMKDLDYSGDIALNQFGLKLDFTGVDYSFEDTVVPLSRGRAILNNIGVRDGRSNSQGSISGAIYFETLSSMAVELIMRADNLLMLNTSQSDYDLFWGRVYGQGDLYVSGPVKALSIQTPNMRALSNSVFTFNSNSTSSVEEFKMLRFLKEDDGIISVEQKAQSGANMHVDFNLAVDRGTTVNVLVGDDIGDISVRGESNDLRFVMSRSGNIELNGTYSVDTGTFTSKAVLNRTFQIVQGSSIRWDGNAMTPALDITANYVRTVSNAGDYLGVGQLQPINVLLQTRITQTLNNPRIELGVSAMDVSSQIKETLASRMAQEDEKVIQFGSVLLLNRFNTTSSGMDVGNIAEDTGYNLLFKQLGSVLNTISNEFQIDLNYVRGDEASNTGDRANAGVNFDLSPRVKVKTGVGIPLSRGAEGTDTDLLSGEGTVEIDISKKNDGTLVLRGYSKPMNIGMGIGGGSNGAANQTYGGGVVWSKSFNNILKRKKKENKSGDKPDSVNTNSQVKDTLSL